MILRNPCKILSSAAAIAALAGQSASAAGFEKSILWSGKYAGQGNAAVSSVSGAESIYFNPANLAGSKGTDLSVNLSPTFSKFTGPAATSGTTVEGKQTFSPIFGALASYAINEKLALGVGSYVSAGASSEFEGVTAGGKVHNPKTSLSAIEYALGAGYEVMPGLKIGGSYRITQVNADFTFMKEFVTTSGEPNGSVSLSDMSTTNAKGFRLGASYTGDKWAVGANYRSAIDFTLEGASAALTPFGAAVGSAATASSTLPAQLSVGGHYTFSPEWDVNAEYVYTNYEKVNQLNLTGMIGSTNLANAPVPMNWSNQSNYRLGAIYSGMPNWTWRAGYVYTSQVTNSALARSTLAPPGAAHSFTAGFTTGLTSQMDLSAAAEYATASGTATATTSAGTLAGDYKASGFMAHTGVSYKF